MYFYSLRFARQHIRHGGRSWHGPRERRRPSIKRRGGRRRVSAQPCFCGAHGKHARRHYVAFVAFADCLAMTYEIFWTAHTHSDCKLTFKPGWEVWGGHLLVVERRPPQRIQAHHPASAMSKWHAGHHNVAKRFSRPIALSIRVLVGF